MIASWIQPKHIEQNGKPKPNAIPLEKLECMNDNDGPSVIYLTCIDKNQLKQAHERACKFCKKRSSANQPRHDINQCDCQNSANGIRALVAESQILLKFTLNLPKNQISTCQLCLKDISTTENPGHHELATTPPVNFHEISQVELMRLRERLLSEVFTSLQVVQSLFSQLQQ